MAFPRVEDIKKMRKQMDLTQNELARMSSVSQSTIAKLERGNIAASYQIVTRVFEALENEGRKRKINRTARDVMHSPIISIEKGATLAEASELMKRKGYSQLPVISSDNVAGSISDQIILDKLREGIELHELSAIRIEEVMNEGYPVIPEHTPVETVASILASSPAVLVSRKGKLSGIITKSDLLKLI